MIRLGLLFLTVTLSATIGCAQIESLRFHVEGNYYWLSNKNFDENNLLPSLTMIQNGDYGFEIGYSAKIKLKGKFSIDTDIEFSKNKLNSRDPNGVKQSFGYIGLSEKLSYSINSKLSIYSGPYFDYLVVLTGGNFISPDTNVPNLKRYDFGVINGLAYRFGNIEIFGDLSIGLISLFNKDAGENFTFPDSKTRSLSIGLTYIFD